MVELKPDLGKELYAALSNAIVVSYARPVSDNEPLGALPKRWSKFDDPRHQDTRPGHRA
jgi:hypothetical protein